MRSMSLFALTIAWRDRDDLRDPLEARQAVSAMGLPAGQCPRARPWDLGTPYGIARRQGALHRTREAKLLQPNGSITQLSIYFAPKQWTLPSVVLRYSARFAAMRPS